MQCQKQTAPPHASRMQTSALLLAVPSLLPHRRGLADLIRGLHNLVSSHDCGQPCAVQSPSTLSPVVRCRVCPI